MHSPRRAGSLSLSQGSVSIYLTFPSLSPGAHSAQCLGGSQPPSRRCFALSFLSFFTFSHVPMGSCLISAHPTKDATKQNPQGRLLLYKLSNLTSSWKCHRQDSGRTRVCTPDRELEACVGGFSVARSQISPNAMTHETRCGELSVLTRRGVVEARRGEAGRGGAAGRGKGTSRGDY